MKDAARGETPIGTQTNYHPAQRNTRRKHESIRRRRALEGDIDYSLSEMPEARPLQLRMQSIAAGKTIHITTISYTAARKPQVGSKNHECRTQG